MDWRMSKSFQSYQRATGYTTSIIYAYKFRFESDTSETAAGAALFQFQQSQWVLSGYHSKKLPHIVQKCAITETNRFSL